MAPIERLLEGIDVVDPLADKRAFAKHVLVDIRDGARVRVDARLPPVQPCIARAVRPRQTDRHARLQDAVALDDTPLRRVVARAIQRVRHGADELPRRIARQLRIGVQGDDVLHAGQDRGVTDDERKTLPRIIACIAAQQRIQVSQFAALAFITHPDAFLRVPSPRAVEQVEMIAPARFIAVFPVQLVYARARQLHQRCVLGERLQVRVAQIGHQAEVQAVIPIRQKADFQRLDQILDARCTGKHGRNHHQRARLRWDSCREVHSGQRMRRDHQGCQPVHQRHGQLTCAQQQQRADRPQYPTRYADGKRLRQQACGDAQRDQRDGAQIQEQWHAARRSTHGR